MRGKRYQKILLSLCVAAASFTLCGASGYGQEGGPPAPSSSRPSETVSEVSALSALIHDLQSQVQALNSQLSDLRTEQQRSTEETRDLRRELDLVKAQSAPPQNGPENPRSVVSEKKSAEYPTTPPPSGVPQEASTPERLARLEENQELVEGKLNDQYQTKIESGSKYRLRLSGLVLLNLYDNRGQVTNQDIPQYADTPDLDTISPNSFGGSLRQSQIKLEAFGPNIGGARTSADLQFDFAGGFPNTENGAVTGLVRLRTGTIHLDWANTSIVAGQDRLFFVPLAPTSLATLAVPSLSYAGNLWGWTPQVRIEHRFSLSDASSILLQAGILDSLSGDLPDPGAARSLSWGEESGMPAYALRVAWSHPAFGQTFTVGVGGYYGRQNWGFNRTLDGWAGTTDLTLPLGKLFEFTGAFYRGRALGGLAGAIGQSVLFSGPYDTPSTKIYGVDSMGGWAQLKFKPRTNFEINGAFGVDNPFARELRAYQSNSIYPDSFSKNMSPLVNFIYQIRSDILFSMEYRWLLTSDLDRGMNTAGHTNLSLGYIF